MTLLSYLIYTKIYRIKQPPLNNNAKQIGLNINHRKTELMCLNTSQTTAVKIEGKYIAKAEKITYLGSIVCKDGGASEDIQNRVSKARNIFRTMNNIWKSQQYSKHTKLRLYQSCVLSTLLYGSECWRMTENDLRKLSTVHTRNLRYILRIFWPRKISNEDLLKQYNIEGMTTILLRRRWKRPGFHHKSGPSLDTKREQKKKKTEKYMAKKSRG